MNSRDVKRFLLREWLLVGAVIALLGSIVVFNVMPYYEIIDFKMVFTLWVLFSIVRSLEVKGVFVFISRRVECQKFLPVILLVLTGVFALFFTNDVAILSIVPLTLALRLDDDVKMSLIILETSVANIYSSISPIGSPQSFFIYYFYHVSLIEFFQANVVLVMGLSLLVFLFLWKMVGVRFEYQPELDITIIGLKKKDDEGCKNKDVLESDEREKTEKSKEKRNADERLSEEEIIVDKLLFASARNVDFIKDKVGLDGLFFVMLLGTVLHVFPIWVGIPVLLYYLFWFRDALKIDYSLLLTFLAFFGFTSIIARVVTFHMHDAFMVFLITVVLSQVISNVPATLLLADFTRQWKPLLWGATVGGFGTIIGSLANVIAYRLVCNRKYNCKKFLVKFHVINLSLLISGVLIVIGILFL